MLFSLSALTAKAGAPTTSSASDDHRDARGLGAHRSQGARRERLVARSFELRRRHGQPHPGQRRAVPARRPAVTAPAAAAPMSIPPAPAKSKTGLFIGLGAGFAVLCIVGAFVVMQKGGDKPAAPTADTVAAPPPVASVAPPPVATEAPAAEASAAPSASASAQAVAAGPKGKGGGSGSKGGAAAPAKGGSSPPAGGAAAAPAAAAPAKKGNCGCAAGDLMCAMKCSAGGK